MFCLFVFSLTFNIVFTFLMSSLQIILVMLNYDKITQASSFVDRLINALIKPPPLNIIPSIIIFISTITSGWFLCALTGFTCFMICKGITTNEDAKLIKEKTQLYNRGCLLNWIYSLCMPETASYIDLNIMELPHLL